LMKRIASAALNYGQYASDKVKDAYDTADQFTDSAKDAWRSTKEHGINTVPE
uniref:Movement protein n=1 Tax=Gongylonema pulchrum TaxID=637853 RepID=A0A183DHX1_9BILA